MRKILLTATFIHLLLIAAYSQLVSLGTETGSGSTNVLLSTSTTNNNYSRTISIYTGSEIAAAGGVAGSFTSLYWKKSGTGEYTFNNATLKVYIKNTTNTLWATAPTWDAEINGAKQVFSSTTYSIPTGTGFKQVVFDSSFAWDGTSNIEILVDWYRPNAPTASINWSRSTTTSANASRVGPSLSDIATFLINSNRPLVQLQIGSPLPVKLGSFSASVRGNNTYLNWRTLTEQNTRHFEVEVSDDGTVFNTCGTISATGNSSLAKDYSFIHQPSTLLTNEYLFYRLKVVDNDGKYSYSKVVKLTLKKAVIEIAAYPNPVKDVFALSIAQSGTEKFNYSLATLDGRMIAQRAGTLSGSTVLTIDALTTQPAGTYILQVWIGNISKQIKLVKQ